MPLKYLISNICNGTVAPRICRDTGRWRSHLGLQENHGRERCPIIATVYSRIGLPDAILASGLEPGAYFPVNDAQKLL